MAICPDCGKKFKRRKSVKRCQACEEKGTSESAGRPLVQGTLIPSDVEPTSTLLSTEQTEGKPSQTDAERTLVPGGQGSGTLVPGQLESSVSESDGTDDPPKGTVLAQPDSAIRDPDAERDAIAPQGDRRTMALPPEAVAKNSPLPANAPDPLSTSDFIRSLPSDFASPSATIRIDALRESVMDCTPAIRSLFESGDAKSNHADYEILGKIGEGGMGVIYRALQKSINREVAIKKIKLDVVEKTDIQAKFITEAAFTGELAHPNIVPIHDLGLDDDGGLFYSMKVVDGEPWQTVLPKNSRAENLDILLRVADAVAFAHSKDIIHRDLKPENIMIGEFGEVVVMDWGLAAKVTDGRQPAPGGSPAYMAPEMANAFLATMSRAIPGVPTEIGDYSDIYLLGAMLFELATGKPPHNGGDDVVDRRYEVFHCLSNAAKNEFVSVADPSDPLVEIALKAMASDPNDRYASVEAFQAAIRQYEAHAQSIGLAERAENDLKTAEQSRDYDIFARSLFGFQDALELWPENQRAVEGERNAKVAYAQAAFSKNDFDLGLSLLDPTAPGEAELHRRLQRAARGRDRRESALRLFKFAVFGLGVALILGSVFFVKRERDTANVILGQKEALEETVEKLDANIVELEATKTDLTNTIVERDKTNKQLTDAKVDLEQKTEEAIRSSKLAQDRLFQAEYGDFASSVALARSNIDDGAFENAIEALDRIRAGDDSRSLGVTSDWEWGRLRYLSHPEIKFHQTGGVRPRVAVARNRGVAISAGTGEDGCVARAWDMATQSMIYEWPIATAAKINDVAVTPDGQFAFVACTTKGPRQPSVIGWSMESGERVSELQTHFSKKDLGDTRQLRISGKSPYRLVSAGAARESKDESVLIYWEVSPSGGLEEKQKLTGYFAEASDIDLNHDGSLLISTHKRRSRSGTFLRTTQLPPSGKKPQQIDVRTLDAGTRVQCHPKNANVFITAEGDTLFRYDVSGGTKSKPIVVHRFDKTIEAFTYSPDGSEIICGTNEGTLERLDVASRTVTSSLGGHDTPIVDCDYHGDFLASVDQSGGLRFWNLRTYIDESVTKGTELVSASITSDGSQIASLSSTGVVTRKSKTGFATTTCGYLLDPSSKSETTWRHYDLASKRLFTMTSVMGDSRSTIRVWDADGRPTGFQLSVSSSTLPQVAPGGKQVILAIPNTTSVGGKASAASSGVRVWNVDGKSIENLDILGDPTAIALPTNFSDIRRDLIVAKGIGLVSQGESRLREGRQGGRVVAIYPSPMANVYVVRRNTEYRIETDVVGGRASQIEDVPSPRQLSFGGGRLALLSVDGAVELWDCRTSPASSMALPTTAKIRTAAVSPNGEEVWFAYENPSNLDEHFIYIWILNSNELRKTSIQSDIGDIRVIDEQRALISTRQSDQIFGTDGREIQSYGGDMVQSLFSQNNDSVVLGSDGVVRIWPSDAESVSTWISGGEGRKVQRLLSVDDESITAITTDGAVEPTGTISILSTSSGILTPTTATFPGFLRAATSNGKTLAVAAKTASGETLYLGDVSKLEAARELELGEVTSIAIARNGTRVAVGMTDGIAIFQLDQSGSIVGEPITNETVADITSIRFSPSGKRILTGHSNGNVAVWYFDFVDEDKLKKGVKRWGKLVDLRKLHNAAVHSLEFSSGTLSLLTADANGTALRYALPTTPMP